MAAASSAGTGDDQRGRTPATGIALLELSSEASTCRGTGADAGATERKRVRSAALGSRANREAPDQSSSLILTYKRYGEPGS